MRVVNYFVQVDEIKCTGAKSGQEKCSRANVPYCQAACPMHIDVKGYIGLIREKRFDDALRLIKKDVPFPRILGRVCPHPCESMCRRREIDEPIAINALKRTIGDYANFPIQSPVIALKKEEKVAIVGAGPAGLTAAYYLAEEGYPVTVFEKLRVAGGMLAVGLPKFRLPNDILSAEIQMVQDMGVEIKTGVTFGEHITLEDLNKQGYFALFLATGLHRSLRVNVEGEDLPGVFHGIEFLRETIYENRVNIGKKVIVIGGGNVAVDAALTAKRLGAQEISIVCLEKREEMPAWDYEIKEALDDGIKIINSLGPRRFLKKDGKLSGIELRNCIAVFDEKGTFNPRYDETDLTRMNADTAIIAIGQTADLTFAEKEGIRITPAGKLDVDPDTLQSNIEWVFVGGDVLDGPKTVVDAMASGKKAAESIKRYIRGEDLAADREWEGPYETDQQMDTEGFLPKERCPTNTLNIDQRKGIFDEINLCLEKPEAIGEAERCMSCECHMCEIICPTGAITIIQQRTLVDEEKCVACFRCVDACQQNAIRIVSRPEPMTLGLDPSEVDQVKLKELCIKAHLHPRQILCLCSATRVDEAAAAILKGAKTPEEISLMTGANSGCGLYCLEPMLRLLKAHGVEIKPPKSHRWYNITPSIWDISPELSKKYPDYYLEEDKKLYRKIP
jgi:NADPH-dependent glutamate synthase beta subunit-like oxidoreductase/bacterioferritin-associated ferredoxin